MGPCGPGAPPLNKLSVLVDAVTSGGGGGCSAVRSIHLCFSLHARFTMDCISSTRSMISLLFRVSFIFRDIAANARST